MQLQENLLQNAVSGAYLDAVPALVVGAGPAAHPNSD
jgi:hypothetical protein